MPDEPSTFEPQLSLDGLDLSVRDAAATEIHACLEALGEFPELRSIESIVVPPDFTEFVRSHLKKQHGLDVDYSADRTHGMVAGKTMHSVVGGRLNTTIVVSNDLWLGTDGGSKLSRWTTLAHEFFHVVRDVKRFDSDPEAWSREPDGFRETLAVLLHNAAEEYFVEKSVGGFLSATVTDGEGKHVSFTRMVNDILRFDFSVAACALVDRMRELFLDDVTQFKTHQIPIEELWTRTVKYLEELLIALARMAAAHDESDVWPAMQAALATRPNYGLFMSTFWPSFLSGLSGNGTTGEILNELEALLGKCGLHFESEHYLAVDWTDELVSART